jgi:hypothetical protein
MTGIEPIVLEAHGVGILRQGNARCLQDVTPRNFQKVWREYRWL